MCELWHDGGASGKPKPPSGACSDGVAAVKAAPLQDFPPLRLILELKGPGWSGPRAAEAAAALAALLKRAKFAPLVRSVSSFDHGALAAVRGALPGVPVALLFPVTAKSLGLAAAGKPPAKGGAAPKGSKPKSDAMVLPANFCAACARRGAAEAHVRAPLATYEVVQTAHAAGLRVMAWFPGKGGETVDALVTLIESGVDGICTNQPRACLALRRNFYNGPPLGDDFWSPDATPPPKDMVGNYPLGFQPYAHQLAAMRAGEDEAAALERILRRGEAGAAK